MGFTVKDILHDKAHALLRVETTPGLGCTEPAAIGLAAAAAAALLPGLPLEEISIEMDPNLFKNALGVVIPGAAGSCGHALAAAMGAVVAEPGQRLQIFSSMNPDKLARAKSLVQAGKVHVRQATETQGLYVAATVKAGDRIAMCVIAGRHDGIKSLTLDGQPAPLPSLEQMSLDAGGDTEALEQWLMGLSLEDMVDLVQDMDREDMGYIRKGLDMNLALARHGLERGAGLSVGKSQQRLLRLGLLQNDICMRASVLTSAGIDSRMGGVMLPAMTLAGSGNQCITAGLPVAAAAEFATLENPDTMLRAVTLSYLVTCRIKAHSGRLSALCGSGVAGGAGVAAAVAHLFGGDVNAVGGAINNHVENYSTLICDGAKTSCALKLAEAAAAAVKAALLSLNGCRVSVLDGVIGMTPEETMANVGRMARTGLQPMDGVILDIMNAKCC